MKKVSFNLLMTKINRYLTIAIFTLWGLSAFGQSEKELKAITSIAVYLHNNVSLTDEIISGSNVAYYPAQGSVLEKEWPVLNPAIKIAIAYKAAENARPGIGGEQLLAVSIQTLSQIYEASTSEEEFKEYLHLKCDKLVFSPFNKDFGPQEVVKDLPNKVKNAIGTIVKYTDAGVLGGVREVLISFYDFSEVQANEVLLSNNTLEEILINAPKDINQHERILKKISYRLFETFEAASYDEHLLNLFMKDEQITIKTKFKPTDKQLFKHKDGINAFEKGKSKGEYQEYYKKNVEDPSFDKMKRSKSGFGGIILGNSFSSTFTHKLLNVRWIPYIKTKSESVSIGRLEFVFDSFEIKFNNVLQEDIYAANEIIFGDSIKYTEGEGIGLTGLTYVNYPNGMRRNEIIVHPALKYLKLGWSLAISDAYMDCSQDIEDKLKENELWRNYNTAFTNWGKLHLEGWKITETPLIITKANNEINILDAQSQNNVFFTMFGDSDDYQSEVKEFSSFLPALLQISPDFKRLKGITEIITLFRWIKAERVPIFGMKTFKYNNFVHPPNCLVITAEKRLDFYNLEQDKTAIQEVIKSSLDSLKGDKYKEIVAEVKNCMKQRNIVWSHVAKKELPKNKLESLMPELEYKKLAKQIKPVYQTLEHLKNILDTLALVHQQLTLLDSIKFSEYTDLIKEYEKEDKDNEESRQIFLKIKNMEKHNKLFEYYSYLLSSFKADIRLASVSYDESLLKLYNFLEYEIKIIRHYRSNSQF